MRAAPALLLAGLVVACGSEQLERRISATADALIRELRRRPNDLVTYTFYYEESDPETRDITVRELGEEQISALDCNPRLKQRIQAAMP